MLSSVLRSKRAVRVNIEIMRAFVRLRQMLASNAQLARRLDALEKKYDGQFKAVFDPIRQLMASPEPKKRKIGFLVEEKAAAYGHRSLFWLVLLLLCSLSSSPRAATLPTGFTETLVASGMSVPTAMAFAPDGRLFVTQQNGKLRVIKNGTLLATPFVTLTVDANGERGLLGVAFDPDFTTNHFVYVYYTVPDSPAHNRVSRFTANGDVAVAGSETVILELNTLTAATNHNGGALHFGPDDKLYVAVGDNASAANAQTLNNRLGKLLRINPDGTIPGDNPFFKQASGANRAIFALGLRNPFTFAFQPDTGRLFINDVGQNTWEEINEGVAGANYGWPKCEGDCSPPSASFQDPFYTYDHGSGCAIVGGAFYNPTVVQFPSVYVGKYFFSDYCDNWIRYFDPDHPPATNAAPAFATGLHDSPADLQVGPDGSLYYLVRSGGGQVWKIRHTGSQAPSITQHPANRTVTAGQPVTFSVNATGTVPLSYQWQRNKVNITGATASGYTIASTTLSDNGARFRCVVRNASGSATSNEAVLTVTTNRAPTATITQPAKGTLYRGGQTITYAGTGTDPEDGNLPASRFTWQVDFHHNTHTHPFIPATSGQTGGTFTIPTTGHTEANVWYRIYLTVRDSGGLTHTSFVEIRPRTVTLTLASNPSGRRVTLDGQPVTPPHAVLSVVGIRRTLGVVSPQTSSGTTYTFSSWSDGGAATHSIATPANNTTYTASYKATVTAFPNSTVIESGTRRSGSATNLKADDNSYFEVNATTSGTRTSAWYGVFSSVPNGLRNLKITYKGANSQSCTQTMSIYRWTTSSWVQLNSRSVNTTEALIADLVPGGTLADYVSGSSGNGDIRVRVRCTRSSSSFNARGDLMKIVYDRP